MDIEEYGVIILKSGLYQGIVGKTVCLVCRDTPQEAMNDAIEYSKRLNVIKVE